MTDAVAQRSQTVARGQNVVCIPALFGPRVFILEMLLAVNTAASRIVIFFKSISSQ